MRTTKGALAMAGDENVGSVERLSQINKAEIKKQRRLVSKGI